MVILISMIASKRTSFYEVSSLLICSSIERLPEDCFNLFLKVLNEKRGDFLRKCSGQMAQLLDLFSKPELGRKYVLEEADRECVKQEPFDSPRLVGYLSWKQ
jgi:hypothetical protein